MSMANSGGADSPGSEIGNLLVQGFKAAKEGRRDEAYNIFCDVVRRDSNNELGWLYRAATTDDLSEAYVCLQRVLSINPNNEKAQRGIERIQARLNSEDEGGASQVAPDEVASDRMDNSDQDVVSGFNPGRAPNTSEYPDERNRGLYDAPPPAIMPGQPTSRIAYDDTPLPAFRPAQPSQLHDVPASSPPPYMSSYGQERQGLGDDFNPPSYDTAPGPALSSYAPMPPEELVDEPVRDAAIRGRNRNQPTNQQTGGNRRVGGGLAPVFGGMAGARQRGRAAFGNEVNTGLDDVGRQRARRVQMPLLILGGVLAALAVIIFLLVLIQPRGDAPPEVANPAITVPVGTILSGGSPASQVTVQGSIGQVTVRPISPTSAVVGGATVQVSGTTPAGAGVVVVPPPAQTTAAPPPPAQTTAVAPAPPVQTTAAPVPPAPGGAARPQVYTVVAGDSLYRIAANKGVSVNALRAANNGNSFVNLASIFPGDRMVIPVGRTEFGGRGTILKPGETLQAVADRYKLPVDGIVKLNGFNSPDDAKPGDAVLLP